MSNLDDAKKINDHIIFMADEFLVRVSEYINFAVYVQMRKDSALADKTFLENAPEDATEESAGKLLSLLEYDNKRFQQSLPLISDVSEEGKRYFHAGTATTTAFETAASNIYVSQLNQGEDTSWYLPVKEGYRKLAEERIRNANLPERLNKFQSRLGEKFEIALGSIEKARANLLAPDLAINHMRDLIEGLWGEIAKRSREKNPKMFQGFSIIERAKERIRKLVAKCWTGNEEDEKNLLVKLDSLNTLYNDMSQRSASKNILLKDLDVMNGFRDRWIILIESLIEEFTV